MKPKHPLSEQLIALRGRLGKTQPEFAELIGVSPITIARYETSSPPGGTTLLQLAGIADQYSRKDLAQEFRLAFWKEVSERHGPQKGYVEFRFSRQHGDGGFMFQTLQTPEEYGYAEAFQAALMRLRKNPKDRAQARKALQALFSEIASAIPEGERKFYQECIEGKRS